jgi:S-adenosylmethionine:tRNA ribosyltransferase-isomerase
MKLAQPQTSFALPPGAEATEPPEARGLARDHVRLLVAGSEGLTHTRFRELPSFLEPGDLLVVNTSETLPAAIDARLEDGSPVVVHFSTPVAEAPDAWVLELRVSDNSGPLLDEKPGGRILAPDGVVITLNEPADAHPRGTRLWRASVPVEGGATAWLALHGRPISYSYLRGRWPLARYQPVFAREPGSAEMASAGRPFTDRMVTDLVTRGVSVAPVLLHTGVSSQEFGEGPQVERFEVPAVTARQVELARRNSGRVVAVGTTVTRALESAAQPDGTVLPTAGWTDLVIGPDRPPRVVNGLVTGWHTPEASHLLLLEAVAGVELVRAAYRAAVDEQYRWHEFGDSCLLLP